MNDNNDILGKALKSYYFENDKDKLWILSDIMEEDEMPITHYFRGIKSMSNIELIALKHCRGKVLDIGAGAGSHALELQKSGKDVTALDISEGCIEVMKSRGVKSVINSDILEFDNGRYDTILLLMNGIGLSGELSNLKNLLIKLKSLLNKGGQIIFDSSDISYLYKSEDGSIMIDLNADYYGELNYCFTYKGIKGNWFKWLYIDEDLMKNHSIEAGFEMEVLYRGENSDYLARLTIIKQP